MDVGGLWDVWCSSLMLNPNPNPKLPMTYQSIEFATSISYVREYFEAETAAVCI